MAESPTARIFGSRAGASLRSASATRRMVLVGKMKGNKAYNAFFDWSFKP